MRVDCVNLSYALLAALWYIDMVGKHFTIKMLFQMGDMQQQTLPCE